MTFRKKKIITIQILLLFAIIIMIYFTYYNNKAVNKRPSKISEEILQLNNENQNTFFNVKYKGLDLNGNRYEVKSEEAMFDLAMPELINMEIMTSVFYFKDGSILTIKGDGGTYNNITKDMQFRENIVSTYKEDNQNSNMNYIIYSDNLDFYNTDNFLKVYGNVTGNAAQGDLIADYLEFDILSKTLKISMFDNNKVNVNLKK